MLFIPVEEFMIGHVGPLRCYIIHGKNVTSARYHSFYMSSSALPRRFFLVACMIALLFTGFLFSTGPNLPSNEAPLVMYVPLTSCVDQRRLYRRPVWAVFLFELSDRVGIPILRVWCCKSRVKTVWRWNTELILHHRCNIILLS